MKPINETNDDNEEPVIEPMTMTMKAK